jgi:hypothetical protein
VPSISIARRARRRSQEVPRHRRTGLGQVEAVVGALDDVKHARRPGRSQPLRPRDVLVVEQVVRAESGDGHRKVVLRHTVDREVVMSKRSSKVLAVSVPPELARDFEAIADAEGRNRSELFREMLRVYRAYREIGEFETLQRYGAARARAAGVSSEEDVARLIAEVRGA